MRILVLYLLVLTGVPSLAMADSPWGIDLGVSMFNPKSGSGALDIAGGQVMTSVTNAVSFTPGLEYRLNSNWSGELLLSTPMTQDIKFNGGGYGGDKDIRFSSLPSMATLKYYLSIDPLFNIYAGAGISYTAIYSIKSEGGLLAAGHTASGSGSYGTVGQAGFEYRPWESPWSLAAELHFLPIRSNIKIDGNKVGIVDINPFVFTLSANYRF